MAHRSRKAKRNGPTFVALFHYMLDSAGYRALSMTGRAALVEVASLYHGDNNGRLVAPVRWLADRLGTGKSTAARALLELEEKGFIETVKLGSFTRHNRTAAEYRLTFHHCDVDHRLPSKRFIKGAPTYGVDVDSVPPMGPWDGQNHA